MPRRARVTKKEIAADPRYHSVTVAGLINRVMLNGKKSTAERIVYDSLSWYFGAGTKECYPST